MRRAVVLAALLLGADAAAGPLLSEASRRTQEAAERIRPAVTQVLGLPVGGLPPAGVLVGGEGLVLTWCRGTEPGREATVVLAGGLRRPAAVEAFDDRSGATLLRVAGAPPSGGLPAGPDPRAGDPVFAAGHSYGTERGGAEAAVVLATLAQILPDRGRLLLSCATNPGDYGGPVTDREGRLVAVALPDEDAASGLSFAVPLSALRDRFPGLPAAETSPVREWPAHDVLSDAVRAVWPSVVSLSADGAEGSWFTGLAVDLEGGVVTTVPGLAPGAILRVVLADGREDAAKVLGTVERFGVTLLRIEGAARPAPAPLAEAEPPVGSFVAAVGNPNGPAWGRGPLVTTGVLGARNRSDRRYDALLTDAGVNRANSGGPLVTLEGRVLGVTSTLGGDALTTVGANSGVGFAIPAAAIRAHLAALSRGETVAWRPGYLGVVLSLDPEPAGGIRIDGVSPGLPAEAAGIRPGDVILSVGGQDVTSLEDLRRIFVGLAQGDAVEVRVRRGAEVLTFSVTLALRPER